MDARELMIGDIVMYDPNVFAEDEYEPHHKCYAKKIESGEDIDLSIEGCYEPIPLTREMLELNGFKMRERFQYSEDEWIESFVNLECTFKVLFSDKDGFLWNGCDINYIHELQQALRLAGFKELADNFKI